MMFISDASDCAILFILLSIELVGYLLTRQIKNVKSSLILKTNILLQLVNHEQCKVNTKYLLSLRKVIANFIHKSFKLKPN